MSERLRIRQPPSSITGELGQWCYELWNAVNSIPQMSYFSGSNPASSGLSGLAGNLAVNIGKASNVSRLFIHYGSATLPDKTSWTTVA